MMKNCVTSLQSNGTKKLAMFTAGSKGAKKLAMFITSLSLVVGSALTAMAEEADLSTTLQTSVNTMKSDFLGYVAIILPVGLAVFGAVWGIKRAKAFFASIAR